jgi:hypothetical protein
MKKISLNSFAYGLLQVVVCIFLFAVAMDIFIIINDFIGNETIVKNIDNSVDKIFNYGSK